MILFTNNFELTSPFPGFFKFIIYSKPSWIAQKLNFEINFDSPNFQKNYQLNNLKQKRLIFIWNRSSYLLRTLLQMQVKKHSWEFENMILSIFKNSNNRFWITTLLKSMFRKSFCLKNICVHCTTILYNFYYTTYLLYYTH